MGMESFFSVIVRPIKYKRVTSITNNSLENHKPARTELKWARLNSELLPSLFFLNKIEYF